MKILVACEYSGEVRHAFAQRNLNNTVWSVDLLPTEKKCTLPNEYHYQGDVLHMIEEYHWDMMIAFPPCTDICSSGARYFKEKQADGRQQKAIDFFMKMVDADIPRICVENPIGIMSTKYRKPDQIIQPWQFGVPESKATCLWLKNLPKLKPTKILEKPECGYWNNQTPSGQNKLGPSETRGKIRARTYTEIASAMADQWRYPYV
jgi:hypothetical protein